MQRLFFLRHSSILLVFSFLFVAILPACIVVVDDDDDDDHYRRRWSLDVIVYGSVSESPINKSDYSLNLSDESTLSGQADCTGFRGGYAVSEGNAIHVESLNASASTCGAESLANKYLGGLEGATSYTVNGDELVLEFGSTGNSMRFSAVE